MSENTTPQMGSPEKEPLLKSEGTDQTSAEELLDQISAKTDCRKHPAGIRHKHRRSIRDAKRGCRDRKYAGEDT